MKNREVVILPSAVNNIEDITRFVTDHTSELNAIEYADELIYEINKLAYSADSILITTSETIKSYHPQAQRLLTKNRKWNIFFHKTDKHVFVHKVLPSKMIIR